MKTPLLLSALLYNLAALSSASAAEPQRLFECLTEGKSVRVLSREPVAVDSFGRLGLHAGQELTVEVESPGRHHSYLAVVLRVENGGVTKHAPMAQYVLARGTLPAPLTLTLGGIDEFENRQSCRFGRNQRISAN